MQLKALALWPKKASFVQYSYEYESNTLFLQGFLVVPHLQSCEQSRPAFLHGHFPRLWQAVLHKHTGVSSSYVIIVKIMINIMKCIFSR